MLNDLETTIYEVSTRIPQDRLYTGEGLWFKPNGCRFLVGCSDFLQQKSGQFKFVQTKKAGALVNKFDSVATVETEGGIIDLISPVSGVISKVNLAVLTDAGILNQDPYGKAWLVEFEAFSWQADKAFLLTGKEYVNHLLDESHRFTRSD